MKELNKQEMIDFIYDKVSDKSLTFGCKVIDNKLSYFTIVEDWVEQGEEGECLGVHNEHLIYTVGYNIIYTGYIDIGKISKEDMGKCKTIGHPVLIGDVLDYFGIDNVEEMYDNDYAGPQSNEYTKLFELWKDKRKPIEEQSIECITYIYNLIKNGNT